MAKVEIYLLDWEKAPNLVFEATVGPFEKQVPKLYQQNFYQLLGKYEFDGEGPELAERMFMAQGNNRQGEKLVHTKRSLSVGDLVVIDQMCYLVATLGFKIVEGFPWE